MAEEQLPPDPWPRAEYEALPRRLLSRGSRVKPQVWAVDWQGTSLLVKDAASLPWPGVWLAGWLLRRERRALSRIAGVPGVPQLLCEIDDQAFAMSWLGGEPLDRERFQARSRELAVELRRLIDALHVRRVFHLDLRQRQNILLGEDGALSLVDFGAALAPGPAMHWMTAPLLRWVDRQAVLKYLARYAPQELTLQEARAVLRALRWRRLWIFSPHRSRGVVEAVKERLRAGDTAKLG